jgi:hypothetical protein
MTGGGTGQCPVCRRHIILGPDGRLQFHWGQTARSCQGSFLPPADKQPAP